MNNLDCGHGANCEILSSVPTDHGYTIKVRCLDCGAEYIFYGCVPTDHHVRYENPPEIEEIELTFEEVSD